MTLWFLQESEDGSMAGVCVMLRSVSHGLRRFRRLRWSDMYVGAQTGKAMRPMVAVECPEPYS